MKKMLVLILAALSPLLNLFGQDSIYRLGAMESDKSIIREIDKGSWLVYSYIDIPSFSLVKADTDSVVVKFIFLPDTFQSVSDFTILDNTVYFCGMLSNNTPTMGHFSLLSFPNVTINYCGITGVNNLTAIKVFKSFELPPKYSPTHVLMLGENNEAGIFIDALSLSPGSWNTYYITLKTKNGTYMRHESIDILDDYVVISSRRKYPPLLFPSIDTGFVWFIKKPSPEYTPFLTSQNYFPIPKINPTRPVKLTACEGNTCVAAAMGIKNSISGIHVYGFNNQYNIRAIRLVDKFNNVTFKDLCYYRPDKRTDFLLQNSNGANVESRIYTLRQTTFPGATITKRYYSNHKINSLITRKYSSDGFIGSGISINNNTGLNLYKYSPTITSNCSQDTYLTAESIESVTRTDGYRTYIRIDHQDTTVNATPHETNKNLVCP